MYTEKFENQQKLGIIHLTGSNRGLFFTNERQEEENSFDGTKKLMYVYDIYELPDVRNPKKVKNDIVEDEHPYGDETKILRKSLAKILKTLNQYDSEEFKEFKLYNEFVETII